MEPGAVNSNIYPRVSPRSIPSARYTYGECVNVSTEGGDNAARIWAKAVSYGHRPSTKNHIMTINSVRIYEPATSFTQTSRRSSPKPPPKIWYASEPPFKGFQPAPSEGYKQSSATTAIVIDNGMSFPESTIISNTEFLFHL